MIGLKGALEQQNTSYGKISHIWASKQADRLLEGVCVGGCREENKWWTGNGAVCVRDDVGGRRIIGAKEGGIARGGGGDRGCRHGTCFEILICGSGRGLVHRDEKKELGKPLKRGNVPCIREAAMLVESNWGRCAVFLPHIREPSSPLCPVQLIGAVCI